MKKLLCLLGVVLLSLTSCSKDDVSTTPETITTATISELTGTSAKTGSLVSVGSTGSVSERGIVYGTSTGPTISDTKIKDANTGSGLFISNLIGLSFGTTYYVRAYAIAGGATIYGNEQVFTTNKPLLPTITTTAITLAGAHAVTTGGIITADGGGVIAKGIVYGTSTGPTISDTKPVESTGSGTFSSQLTNLLFGTTYYVRAYATNGDGTAYGEEISFKIITGESNTIDLGSSVQVNSIYSAAQSFVPTITTSLAGITVKVANLQTAGDFTLKVYQGAGIGGKVLATQTVSVSGTGDNIFKLTSPVAISSGQPYTFGLTSNGVGNISVTTNDTTYADGTAYQNTTIRNYDLYFSLTYITIP